MNYELKPTKESIKAWKLV